MDVIGSWGGGGGGTEKTCVTELKFKKISLSRRRRKYSECTGLVILPFFFGKSDSPLRLGHRLF